jgi:hypothetical protein
MSGTVSYSATKLAKAGKTGKLPRDSNGYYKVPLGALNVFNSAGSYYAKEQAEALFENSSDLMRRVKGGYLKSERGHPDRGNIRSDEEFLARVKTIDQANVCAHFSGLTLDFDLGKKMAATNPKFALGPGGKQAVIVPIVGDVAPSGPHAAELQRSLDNPLENVAFSVRGFTENNRTPSGVTVRTLVEIVTFDNVVEPGVETANKWESGALESMMSLEEFITLPITEDTVSKLKAYYNVGGYATEDSYALVSTLENSLKRQRGSRPAIWRAWS